MSASSRRGRAFVIDPFREIIIFKNRLFMSVFFAKDFMQDRVLFVGSRVGIAGGRDGWVKRSAFRVGKWAQEAKDSWRQSATAAGSTHVSRDHRSEARSAQPA